MRQWVLSAWGINPGPFWASWAKILPKIFGPLYLYTGGSLFLLPQKTEKGTKRWKSQKVSHPSTNRAQHCLTSVIGRELVHSMWYGRCRERVPKQADWRCSLGFLSKSGFLKQIRISVPGAFNLGHLEQVGLILFWNFSKCFIFILGGQFLLPQRAKCEKGEFFQFQNWMRQRGLSTWGSQTGQFASL